MSVNRVFYLEDGSDHEQGDGEKKGRVDSYDGPVASSEQLSDGGVGGYPLSDNIIYPEGGKQACDGT